MNDSGAAARARHVDEGRGPTPADPPPDERAPSRSIDFPAGAVAVGLCVEDRHEVWVGRAKVRWEGAGSGEAWLPTLRGVVVRSGDRVLVVRPDNLDDPVICGVVDGLRRRKEAPPTTATRLSVRDDESVRVESDDGRPLMEIHRSQAGPVVRLLDDDALVSVDGHLAFRADTLDFEATKGSVRIQAAEDVIVRGEIVRLN